jgi:hypothetical protein
MRFEMEAGPWALAQQQVPHRAFRPVRNDKSLGWSPVRMTRVWLGQTAR